MSHRSVGGETVDGFEAAWRVVEPLRGWLTREQAARCFEAARAVRPGDAIVEIGSHHGKSTIMLAKAKAENVTLVAVDPFVDERWGGGEESLRVFQENLRTSRVDSQVAIHRGTSTTAARELEKSVGLLYVDGAHDRRSVLADIDSWKSHLCPGAAVLLHDAFSAPGVTAAVLQRLLLTRNFEYVGSEGSLAMFRRRRVSSLAAAGSGVRLLGRLGYFCRNIAIKLALRRHWYWLPPRLGHPSREAPY